MSTSTDWKNGDHMPDMVRKILQKMADGLPVTDSGDAVATEIAPAKGTLTDGSGTIASGGASQQIFAANSSRKYFFFENVSSGDLWINFTTAAAVTQPSIKVKADGSFVMEASFVSTEAINVIGATTGQAFVAKQA